MDDNSDYEGSEYAESEFDENQSVIEYGDEPERIENELNQMKENRATREYLINKKLQLLLLYNSNQIDSDVYFGNLKSINTNLFQIEYTTEYLNSAVVELEIKLENLIDKSIAKTKKREQLTTAEIDELNLLQQTLNKLREEYFENEEPLVPEKSLVYEYDSDGYLNNWEYFEEEEINEMKRILKQYKLGIKYPNQSKFKSKEEYENALDKFYKFMVKFLPGYVPKITPTKIGVDLEKINKVPVMEQIKKDLAELKNLGIILSENDLLEIDRLKNIKNELLKLEKDQLIGCIESSEFVYSQNYIQQLWNNRKSVIKYRPSNIKEPINIKEVLVNLLISLGKQRSKLSGLSKEQLIDILQNDYQIPQKLYYYQVSDYETQILGRDSNPKKLTLKFNTSYPIVMINKTPIPEGTDITNEKYYSTYIPINDTLYSKLKEKGSGVEKIWSIPIKTSEGNYVLKKIDNFEEYLMNIKQIINKNIIFTRNQINESKDIKKIKNLEALIEKNLNHIQQIDEYLLNKTITPFFKIKKQNSSLTIPGITYITRWQRELSNKKLLNALTRNVDRSYFSTAQDLVNKLEELIFSKKSGIQDYFDKVNNILFILDSYPEFKLQLLSGQINIYQLVNYHSIYTVSNIKKIKSINNRTDSLNKIYNKLFNSLNFKEFFRSKILKEIIVRRESKRLELLIFDLSTELDYNFIVNNFIKLLVYPFSDNLVKGLITDEQLVIIIRNIKLRLFENIIKKSKEELKTTIFSYTKFDISELEALLSSERLKLKELISDKMKQEAINKRGIFILKWVPPRSVVSNDEFNKWNSLLKTGDLNKLNNYKDFLMNKYNVVINSEINSIQKEINKIEKKINSIQEERLKKIKYAYSVFAKFKKLVNKPKLSTSSVKNIEEYSQISNRLIYELLQAYKRKGIFDFTKNKNLLNVLELYDLNELKYFLGEVSNQDYTNIRNKLYNNITKLNNNVELLNKYYEEALQKLLSVLKINGTTFEDLISNWPKNYPGNLGITDIYGNDLLYFMLRNPPINFYDQFKKRAYSELIESVKLNPKEEYKVEMVLYNPATGEIGRDVYNGYLFEVYRLEKDLNTGLPVMIQAVKEQFNERNGKVTIIPIQYEQPGKQCFIKVPIINPIDPNDTFRWKEVKCGLVGMYPLSYDSCNRFINEDECNKPESLGIGRSKCFYDSQNKICKAEYSR